MVLLFQKEVAERICAKPNTKQYGSVSVLSQLLCNTELLFDISNKAFIPSPKVTSSLVLLTPKEKYEAMGSIDIGKVAKFVNTCFQFRRKTIYSILSRLYPTTNVSALLQLVGLERNQRPETITPDEYINLFSHINFALCQ